MAVGPALRRERMDSIRTYQESLLTLTEKYQDKPLPAAVRQAFLDCPRHRFVIRYRRQPDGPWYSVGPDTLEQHLPHLYADSPLLIYYQEDGGRISTISQPSLVLNMITLLDLKPGMKVLEIGAGSGWNAALMGKLVGKTGHVYSVELIEELARESQENLRNLGMESVTIRPGDGGEGYAPAAPYDRIVFTAGAFDIPLPLHEQLADGGLMLAVIKIPGGGDTLFLLRKENEGLHSSFSTAVGFVPMLGKYQFPELEGIVLENFLKEKQLPGEATSRIPYWWNGQGSASLMHRTKSIRFFLDLALPGYRVFTGAVPAEGPFFGVYDAESHSLVVARQETLYTYGNEGARTKLLAAVQEWVRLGMPTSANFRLRVFPKNYRYSRQADQWVVERQDSLFVWQL
jgi:protein-L-isoaspartate(D-aspartate) O-methyltransferase